MKYTLILFMFVAQVGLSQSNYVDSLTKERHKHSDELIDPSAQILTDSEIDHFRGLDYFDINENYRIHATIKKSKGKKFKMPTSTDRTPIYRRYGYVYFKINDELCTLTVYQNMELMKKKGYEDYLFIPFRDATSTVETYGGGRYLDLRIPTSDQIQIDFNLSYNPYCAYSYRYSCPIPPEENKLKVRIEAGEKTPFGH